MNLKLILLSSVTILFTILAKAQAPIPEILYYRFNGTGNIVLNEASGVTSATDTAFIVGGLTQGPSGQCGNALIGNGQSSGSNFVNTGWQTNLTGTSWTLSFWTNNVPSTTSTQYILGDINAGQLRVFTGGVAGAGNWILRGALTDVYANGGAAPGPTMTTFVYDMPSGEIKSYVNGVLSSTVFQSGGVAITGIGPFMVGGYSTSSNLPNGSFMDEFRLYNRALTLAEIQSLLISGTSSSFSVTECGSYTVPSGLETYTSSGIYMDTIPNVNGCDSIMTIDVTILPLSYDTISEVACDSYDSPSGSYNWTVSGVYTDTLTNALGCDSIITINLTVNQTTFDTIAEFSCGNYTAPDGSVHAASDTFDVVIPNVNACDSLIHIELTVAQPTTSSITESACNSYTAPDGTIYTATGAYTAVIPNDSGCDSTITIALTVEQMDTTLSYSDGILTANQSGVAYQWINCSTMNPIAGATSQSFTPSSNGIYAVTMDGGICNLNSECFTVSNLGLDEFSQLNLVLFPNPVGDELNIVNASGEDLIFELYDNTGKLLQTMISSETNSVVGMQDKAAGIYQLKVRSKFAERTFKIVRN
jgi:hypothetical protein